MNARSHPFLRRTLGPTLAAIVLGLAAPLASASDIVWLYGDGSTSRMTIENGLGGTQYVDCTSGLCNPCANCHVGATATASRYDGRQHQSEHFPRASLPLGPGKTVRLGAGVSVTYDGGDLCAHGDGASWRRCYPAAGSWVLKDGQGRPTVLWSLHAPRKR